MRDRQIDRRIYAEPGRVTKSRLLARNRNIARQVYERHGWKVLAWDTENGGTALVARRKKIRSDATVDEGVILKEIFEQCER